MKKFKEITKMLVEDESGQGATEYILLLVVIVGLVTMFGNDIKNVVKSKIGELSGSIGAISGN